MKVLQYRYIKPDVIGVVGELNRKEYMTPQYIELMSDSLASIKLEGKCAFLYVAGAVVSASEARNAVDNNLRRESCHDTTLVIKELAGYSMHKWIGQLRGKENIRYANISANTCASSLYSVYEAERLISEGYDQVVIVAEEKTSYNTLRIFDEHNIPLKVSEGCAILVLGKGDGISECKWGYEYNRNPFGVTETGYRRVDADVEVVKVHGTGTSNNDTAEMAVFGDRECINYKKDIGHTQGASGLIEICMLLDDTELVGRVLCVASGLGGFYSSCIVNKDI